MDFIIHSAALSFFVNAPGNDLNSVKPHDLWIKTLAKILSTIFKSFNVRKDFDGARLPGRQNIINNKRDSWMLPNIMPFLALRDMVPADINRIGLRVVSKSNGNNMWIAFFVNSC